MIENIKNKHNNEYYIKLVICCIVWFILFFVLREFYIIMVKFFNMIQMNDIFFIKLIIFLLKNN
jgi:hypothetical protein